MRTQAQRDAHVIRYVATYVNRDGMRTLMNAAQGRHTYDTPEQAQAWINACRQHNNADTLRSVYGPTDTYEVRPCECWPGHGDPKGVYFD